jgi:hypothetical protein
MGHADRPWQHDAFGLDTQSRRVCLPFAGRSQFNANTDANSFTYNYTYTYTQAYSNTKASRNADTAPVLDAPTIL